MSVDTDRVFDPLGDNLSSIQVVDYMGGDESVCDAARVSYGNDRKREGRVRDNSKLINYLWRNGHGSPFEMAEIKFHIRAPIFVARQWFRHRTANVNEISGRYTKFERDYYVPTKIMGGISKTNKQTGAYYLGESASNAVNAYIVEATEKALATYDALIDMSIALETARMVLPVNMYTRFYWKTDLRNLLGFISKRYHADAQYEIRVYAQILDYIVSLWCPLTYRAFHDSK